MKSAPQSVPDDHARITKLEDEVRSLRLVVYSLMKSDLALARTMVGVRMDKFDVIDDGLKDLGKFHNEATRRLETGLEQDFADD